MSDIEAGVTYLMQQVSKLPSIQDAPDKPPESPADFPFSAAWPRDGIATLISKSFYQNKGYIRLEVHVARSELEADIDQVYPLLDQVLDILHDPDHLTLGGNIDHLISSANDPIAWVFGPMDWGENAGSPVQTIGWRIDIPFKYKRTVT